MDALGTLGDHRHLDRHGPGWQAVSEGVESEGGWPLHLERFALLLTPANPPV